MIPRSGWPWWVAINLLQYGAGGFLLWLVTTLAVRSQLALPWEGYVVVAVIFAAAGSTTTRILDHWRRRR